MPRMKKLLAVLNGEQFKVPPVWMMRQAGRYLPEYRALREKAGSFLDLCYNPIMAAEVTLQPIKRFHFDGAILFSDILILPHALGQEVWFEAGEGPRLKPTFDKQLLGVLEKRPEFNRLDKIYETVRLVKEGLPSDVTFLGFCGAPFTVASYMIAGQGGDEQAGARLLAYREPELFQALIDVLVEGSIDYLVGQFKAGVDAVQVFDSWASILPPHEFEKWCLLPFLRILDGVRLKVPDAPFIFFPRGVTNNIEMLGEMGVNGIGVDWRADIDAVLSLQDTMAVQGNIDPLSLLAGGRALEEAVEGAMGAFSDGRYIFNLGHGILPQTPISHVEAMIKMVRG
jgi:uroporphyrinogen decarboxylase